MKGRNHAKTDIECQVTSWVSNLNETRELCQDRSQILTVKSEWNKESLSRQNSSVTSKWNKGIVCSQKSSVKSEPNKKKMSRQSQGSLPNEILDEFALK